MVRFLILSFLLSASAASQAAVYQCKVNGQTIFSDRPCGDNAKKIEVVAPQSNGGGSMQSDAGDRFMAIRDAEREMRGLVRKKDAIQKQMDQAHARWQREKRRANNNLAGATWEQSLAQEAEVMRQRYQSQINDVERDIERLEDRQSKL